MSEPTHVLSLCDRTGNMCRPWAEDGYVCIAVDLAHDETFVETVGDGRIVHVNADVAEYEPPDGDYAAAFAFPPCTDLAVSGARWFKEKGLMRLAEAIETVAHCQEMLVGLDCPYLIENPVSTLSTYWREPDYTFHPYSYDGYTDEDDAYSKTTCLWTGGGFVMPPEDGVDDYDDRIHTMPPGEDRSAKRSETPMGFARAVYQANGREKDD